MIQRALGASCVRVSDGHSSEAGRGIAADERIAGESCDSLCICCCAHGRSAGAVLSFPSWMGAAKSEASLSTDQEKVTKVRDAACK